MSKRERYAQDTSVPVDRSKQELEKLVRAHGATGFAAAWDQSQDLVEFLLHGKQIRFVLPRITGRHRSQQEQLERSRWRALVLVVKAKLEAVRSGIAVFEQEFLGFIVVPTTNRTVYEHAAQQLEAGQWSIDRLLPAGKEQP